MNGTTIAIALLMGITGSMHCAGMCGPIVCLMPFQMLSGAKKIAGIALYHTGRISIYALYAFVLHAFAGFFQPAAQQYVSVALGSLLLIAGILSFFPGIIKNPRLPFSQTIIRQFGKFMNRPGLAGIFGAGVLNGLLPCGLVYMALSATMVLPGSLQAAAFMMFFGAGTLPMLVTITLVRNRLPFLRSPNLKKWIPLIMFLFGGLLIVRGMNLGIPYLSPKVAVTGRHTIQASCCHHTQIQTY